MERFEVKTKSVRVLGCVAVVALAGYAVSFAANYYSQFLNGRKLLENEISDHARLIHELNVELDKRYKTFYSVKRSTPEEAKEYDRLLEGNRARSEEISMLDRRCLDTNVEITSIEIQLEVYQAAYRGQQAEEAVGEALSELRTLKGRVYHEVVISQVTPVGLEIRHSSGLARIEAPDLGPHWQDRFQWDDADRLKLMAEERDEHSRIVQELNGGRPIEKTWREKRSSELKFFKERAQERVARKEFVDKLDLQLEILHYQLRRFETATRENKKSMPGSLERWDERIPRLKKQIQVLRSKRESAVMMIYE